MIIETDKFSGQQLFAFRFQDNSHEEVIKSLKQWQQMFFENPIFSGKIELNQTINDERIEDKVIENKQNIKTFNQLLNKNVEEDEFTEQNYFNEQLSMNYYKTTNTQKGKKNMQDIVFNTDLGKFGIVLFYITNLL